MEIATGVHAVPLKGAIGHLIDDDGLTLIDAGLPGSAAKLIAYIAEQGRSMDELVRIVCTHGHPDHIGGVRELAGDRVDVMLHPADAAALEVTVKEALRRPSRSKVFAITARKPKATIPMTDGDILPILGGLEVIHTPGHTAGSVCLYAARDRLLFVGDALEVRRGVVGFASPLFSDDIASARTSVERLAGRDVALIIFAHSPPWSDDPNGVLGLLAAQARKKNQAQRANST